MMGSRYAEAVEEIARECRLLIKILTSFYRFVPLFPSQKEPLEGSHIDKA